ncbi:MAG: hypothetical protein ISR59_08815 [Anaerolineales bacterium]|nr:hypothetical protein [Candidatus Desulfolinea nitratireducens]MBL6961199.1 hypothetical protein [Anaerolineales bacterium]
MIENVWQLEEGEVRKPGIVHVVMLALFTGIGIVVGTFGSLVHNQVDNLELAIHGKTG